ncbi:lipopolysaccharide biosynthesis protein [Oceanotoga teriensis]|uniref:lipopolysaccharide biosynthesis protein n=1 Tax=Oceanotoga teriensis TaxID=515440 RepID=UPI002713DB6F|nr:oligosaccharide flippase family protein [Oceanotoga teriensis]MDO7975808.1 oligosaccharide flippase family protein [Oceanotoga teriensis]
MIKKILNNKVIKAGSWYTVTNFFTKGITFLTLPIFTRLLSTSDYGIVNLYTSYLSIFTIIFSLDLVASIQRGKFDFKDDFNGYVSSVLFLGTLSFLFCSSIVLIFHNYFSKILELSNLLIFILLLNSFFSFVQNLVFAKFQVEYNYKKVSLITIFSSLMGVFLSIFLITKIFPDEGYLGQIIGKAFPVILFGFILMMYIFLKGKKLIDLKYWKYSLLISLPLILHGVSGIINSQFDRIIINKYIGSSETGIYSFAYNVGMIIMVLWTSTNQAWVPWFFEKMELKDFSSIKKRAKNFRDFFTIAYIFILFISPEIIKLMSDSSYWEGLYIVPFIFMSYYFNLMYSFEVNIEFYTKKTHLISIGTIFAALVNVILNLIFVPLYGSVAAAITTVISNFALFAFHYLITNKVLKINIFGFKFHFISLIYVILSTLIFIIFKDYLIIRIVILLISFWYLFKKYKNILK